MRRRRSIKIGERSICVLMVVILLFTLLMGHISADPRGPRTRSTEKSWLYEVVEGNNSYGDWWGGEKDLELDSRDRPHLIYASGVEINYSYYNGEEWVLENVSSSAGANIEMDLSLGPDDQPHILHFGYGKGMKYSWKTDDGWEQIDIDPYATMPSIQVDDNGVVHMAYRKGGLVYATYNSSVMKTWLLGTGNFYGISLVLDSANNPRISCSNRSQDELCYFTRNGLTWNQWVIPEGAGAFTTTKLVLDSKDQPQICYTIRPDFDRVDRVWWTGTGWSHENVDPRTGSVNLEFELDRNDIPHVVTDDVFYWSKASGEWEMTEIDIPDYQWGSDFLEFDSMNNPHMVAGMNSAAIIYVSYGFEINKPVADAGDNIIVEVGKKFQLDGTGSHDDTGISRYIWRTTDTQEISIEGPEPEITLYEVGEYHITLRVVDTSGNWDEDVVKITVKDSVSPVADAGPDVVVDQHMVVDFDGYGTSDNSQDINYTWTFEDNGSIVLYGVGPAWRFDKAGIFLVTLSVFDASGNMASDEMVVTVNDITSPEIASFEDREILQFTSVELNASGCSDNVGIEFYNWSVYRGSDPLFIEGGSVNLLLEEVGEYLIVLTIWDAAGNMNSTEFTITSIDNFPPEALVICPSMVNVTELFTLDGSGSYDNIGIVNWTWEVSRGLDKNVYYGEQPQVSIWESGNYIVKLTVIDAVNLTSTNISDIVVIDPNIGDDGGKQGKSTALLLIIIILSLLIALILGVLGTLYFIKRRSVKAGSEQESFKEDIDGPRKEHDTVDGGSLESDGAKHFYTSDISPDPGSQGPGSISP